MINPNQACMNCFCELADPKGVCPCCGYDNATAENAAHQLEAGSILAGIYLIGRVLGQGGFGITYVGMDLNLELKVAIKEYYPEGCVTRDAHTHASVMAFTGEKTAFFQRGKERFVEEARTLARFSGDGGIANVRTFFHENGTAYIVMDYVEGETLKSHAARNGGKLPAGFVLEEFRPLLRSIARVHAAGLLHRDISPDNIILRPDGRLVLLDFGAARQMSVSGEHSNTINVKHGFAPEEQYRTRGEQGPWTDIYALSATIYRLITGVMPPQALDRILNDEPLAPPSTLGAAVTPRQEAALLHGLACRAADRTQTMQAFMEQLYGEGAESPEAARPLEQPENTVSAMEPVPVPAPDEFRESAPEEAQPQPEENKPARKANKKAIVIAAAAVAVVLIGALLAKVGVENRHNEAIRQNKEQIAVSVQQKDYTAALSAIQNLDASSGEYDQTLYDSAQTMLGNGEYATALAALDKIQNADQYDFVTLEDEATYIQIQERLGAGDYATAESLLSKIQQTDHYDMEEVEARIEVQRVTALFEAGQPGSAIPGLIRLKKLSPTDALTLVMRYQDAIYTYAVSSYQNSHISDAKDAFTLISEYERADDYLFLINLVQDRATHALRDITESEFMRLMSLAGFENAGEFLMYDNSIAFRFMKGYWSGGSANMHFYEDKTNWWATWEITGIQSGTWRFEDSGFYITDNNDNEKKVAEFIVLDQNTISIQVVSTGNSYKLTRH